MHVPKIAFYLFLYTSLIQLPKMIRQLLFPAILLMMSAFSAFAQIQFGGTLFDMDSKTPLPGVVFVITSKKTQQSLSAASNAEGKYQFTLPASWEEDEYPMILQKDGYYPVNGIVLVQKNAVRNFYLKSIQPKTPAVTEVVVEAPELAETGLQLRHLPINPKPGHLVVIVDVSCKGEGASTEELKSALQDLGKVLNRGDKISIVIHADEPKLMSHGIDISNYATLLKDLQGIACSQSPIKARTFEMAYQLSIQHYVPHGNNKVLYLTNQQADVIQATEKSNLELLIRQFAEQMIALDIVAISKGTAASTAYLQRLASFGKGMYAPIAVENLIGDALIFSLNQRSK
jgi:hypothetical protein